MPGKQLSIQLIYFIIIIIINSQKVDLLQKSHNLQCNKINIQLIYNISADKISISIYLYTISVSITLSSSNAYRIKNWVFKALPCDGNILNIHLQYLSLGLSVCNILYTLCAYLWPGICETMLGAGNTQLSATFLPSSKSLANNHLDWLQSAAPKNYVDENNKVARLKPYRTLYGTTA